MFSVSEFEAVQMPEHRALYLEYEGPLSGARGDVVRVAAGLARVDIWNEDEMKVTLEAAGKKARVLTGVRLNENLWRFVGCE